MQKILYFILLFFLFTSTLLAKTDSLTYWNTSGNLGLNISQVGLKNWNGGGENSLSLNGLTAFKFSYSKNKINWDNSLEFGYGILKQGNSATRKTDDKIILNSRILKKGEKNWGYSALFDFRTQFDKGFNFVNNVPVYTSNFLAPAFITLALGAEFKPSENFVLLLSPVTGKLTVVNSEILSNQGAFGLTPGENLRAEFGASINAEIKTNIAEGIDYQSKLNLFTSYNRPELVDVIWDNLILMKVNKFISASFTTQLLYDFDTKDPNDGKAKIQFKEVIAVGLLYKF